MGQSNGSRWRYAMTNKPSAKATGRTRADRRVDIAYIALIRSREVAASANMKNAAVKNATHRQRRACAKD